MAKFSLEVAQRFKTTLLIATSCAVLVACGGNEEVEPPASAALTQTATDVSVNLTDKAGGEKKWSSLKLNFAATVDAGPSKGTVLKGDLKLTSSKPEADGSSEVKGVLVVGGDDKENRPGLTDDQKKQLTALAEQYRKDVDAARK
ncbi:MAG: hypothetical protein RL341_1594, partial [Pseudomonadota bacterium]